MSKEVSLKIIIRNPVDDIIYGLQKGKGPHYETVQAQNGNGRDLAFDFTVHVKETGGSLPTLAGPYVQGPAGNRFVYIGIGNYAGQTGASWSGRMKVPLTEAGFQNMPPGESNSCWYCTVPGRNEIGKPFFATVKPFAGWFLHEPPE